VIFVDSSVWIDHLRGTPSAEAARLRALIGRVPLLVGDLVLVEVLQGLASEAQARRVEAALRAFDVVNVVDATVAVRAAGFYRALRARGVTIRRTIDLLIGTFCIINGHALLHRDRDFDPLAAQCGLRVVAA
jgi:predicted nucleic acid-binding protein